MEPKSDTTAFGWLVGLASDGSFAGVAPAVAAALIEDNVWIGANAMILPGVSIDDVVKKIHYAGMHGNCPSISSGGSNDMADPANSLQVFEISTRQMAALGD
jgi:hypothetical protein